MIAIETYQDKFKSEVTELVLSIENGEYHLGFTLEEQPDLADVASYFQKKGGEFWVALSDGEVVGTIGLSDKSDGNAILKKFFVRQDFRKQKVGLMLYEKFLEFAQEKQIKHIILDTPSVAKRAHAFYERAGFVQITKTELPCPYEYPDRDCLLYMLTL